jgi:glycolate oxidase iron-sulfur subunit
MISPRIDSLRLAAPTDLRITYQDSCHLRNAMKVHEPQELLKSIRRVAIVEMTESDRCCGSAGIYNLTQFNTVGMSKKILDEKMTQAW